MFVIICVVTWSDDKEMSIHDAVLWWDKVWRQIVQFLVFYLKIMMKLVQPWKIEDEWRVQV